MLEPEDRESSLLEKAIYLKAMVEQAQLITTCLLARCGNEVTITDEEIEFNKATYEVETDIKASERKLIAVHMKLKLR